MLRFCTVFLFLAALPGFLLAQGAWSQSQAVATPADGNVRPRIEVNQAGQALVLWGDANPKANRIARSNGSGFDAPMQITPSGLPPFVTWWVGAEMAVMNNDVFVVFQANPVGDGRIYAVHSNDGGQTFGDTVRVDALDGHLVAYPTIAVTGSGNPTVAFMRHTTGWSLPRYTVVASTNGGQSYTSGTIVTDTIVGEACDCCPAALAARGDEVAVVYRNNDNNTRDMYAAVSTDGALTFPEWGPIDNNGWFLQSCPTSGPDAHFYGDRLLTPFTSDDRVYLSNAGISDLSDYAFVPIHSEAGASIDQRFPRIAGSGDTLGLVWEQRDGGSEVLFSWSVNGPDGFSMPDTVNIQQLGNQMNPDIAYSNGVFHISWQDDGTGEVMYRTVSVDALVSTGDATPAGNMLDAYVAGNQLIVEAVEGSGTTQVQILSITGAIVAQERVSGPRGSLSTSALPAGNYIVRMRHSKLGVRARKVTINH